VSGSTGQAVGAGLVCAVAVSTIIAGKPGAANAGSFAVAIPFRLFVNSGAGTATGLQAGVFTLPTAAGAGGNFGVNLHLIRSGSAETSRSVSAGGVRSGTAPTRRSA
jgi:predicted RecA/RadA family phage recombinase